MIKNNQINHKCPSCGSTDITHDLKTSELVCLHCRQKFQLELPEDQINNLNELTGIHYGKNTRDIQYSKENIITLKCKVCGASVILNKEELHKKCHWCRHVLMLDEKVDNGVVPDMILPFTVSKEKAVSLIKEYLKKRKANTNSKFKKEFNSDNVIGVYLPYIIVDVRASIKYKGEAEIRLGDIDSKQYQRFSIEKSGDINIHNIIIEANSDKLNQDNKNKCTNIINSILPFDIDKAVEWNVHYLRNYQAELRDVNLEELQELVNNQIKSIARSKISSTIKQQLQKDNNNQPKINYDEEKVEIKGEQWLTAYLPVWLYTQKHGKKEKEVTYYIAVNGQNSIIEGSLPMNNLKINLITIIILIIGIAASVLFYNLAFFVIASIPAIAYKYGMSGYYRNKNKYYKVEETTKVNIYNSNETISPIEISKDSSYLFGSGFEREEGSRANDYKDEHFKSAKEKK